MSEGPAIDDKLDKADGLNIPIEMKSVKTVSQEKSKSSSEPMFIYK